mmetsp:Transcript_40097/g.121231  ORF Transcript_40097/g.121231 Transcript_40097/m.121231 type:complete len:534 (+) Transcript_40097:675-2276(+)
MLPLLRQRGGVLLQGCVCGVHIHDLLCQSGDLLRHKTLLLHDLRGLFLRRRSLGFPSVAIRLKSLCIGVRDDCLCLEVLDRGLGRIQIPLQLLFLGFCLHDLRGQSRDLALHHCPLFCHVDLVLLQPLDLLFQKLFLRSYFGNGGELILHFRDDALQGIRLSAELLFFGLHGHHLLRQVLHLPLYKLALVEERVHLFFLLPRLGQLLLQVFLLEFNLLYGFLELLVLLFRRHDLALQLGLLLGGRHDLPGEPLHFRCDHGPLLDQLNLLPADAVELVLELVLFGFQFVCVLAHLRLLLLRNLGLPLEVDDLVLGGGKLLLQVGFLGIHRHDPLCEVLDLLLDQRSLLQQRRRLVLELDGLVLELERPLLGGLGLRLGGLDLLRLVLHLLGHSLLLLLQRGLLLRRFDELFREPVDLALDQVPLLEDGLPLLLGLFELRLQLLRYFFELRLVLVLPVLHLVLLDRHLRHLELVRDVTVRALQHRHLLAQLGHLPAQLLCGAPLLLDLLSHHVLHAGHQLLKGGSLLLLLLQRGL